MGLIQFPMRKGWKRVHRLVVLPDYQGIGIGTKFQDFIVGKYIENNWKVNCTTTTPALVGALRKNGKWSLVRASRVKNTRDKSNQRFYGRMPHKELGSSGNRITYSFNFK